MFDDYQDLAARTINPALSQQDQVLNMILGLNGEAGELADRIKKTYFQGHDEDREKIREELGDVLWYVAGIATVFGFELDVVAIENITKLKRRYPSGFSSADSINRARYAVK